MRNSILNPVSGARWSLLAGVMLCTPGAAIPAYAQTLGADRPQIHGPLTLAKAVETGLHDSLMVRAARADQKAATAETRMARSQRQPQISANTYLSYGDASNILSTAPEVAPANYLNVPRQGFADQNLTLSVPLYTGGRLEGLVRAASERERAAGFDLGGTQAEIALRIKEAYYRTLLAAENVNVAQARLDATTELVKTTQALFAAGKGLEASTLRVQAEQAEAQRMLTTAQNTQAKALLDVKASMGVRLDSDIVLSDSLTFAPPSGALAAQLANAAQLRPELQASRARLAAAQQQTGVVRATQRPQIYGMAMADGFTSPGAGTREGYTVGVVLSFPLVDAGLHRAQTAEASAQQERVYAELRDLELRVAREVQQAWLDVQSASENYRTAEAALHAAQSAYDVIALRVQNQKGLLVEQLDALAAVTQARGNLAQALYDHSLAVAQLQRAAGRP